MRGTGLTAFRGLGQVEFRVGSGLTVSGHIDFVGFRLEAADSMRLQLRRQIPTASKPPEENHCNVEDSFTR